MRTRATTTILMGVVLAVALASVPAAAAADIGDPEERGPLRVITFPVVGRASYSDTFGAPRSGGRSHAGADVMADKMQPLVAAVAGTVERITIPEPSYGYMLTIRDDEGWSYHYIHINNDTPGTDDGQAPLETVYGPGIVEGARVEPGQLVGYVGDSGNAEDVAPQLHFEIVDPSGVEVNPTLSLDAAERVASPTLVRTSAPSAPAPATEPQPTDRIVRLAGPDRASTAIAVSRAAWPAGGVANVVVANGSSYAEALPASVLAARHRSPLLLWVRPDDEALAAELRRLGAATATIVGSVPSSFDAEGQALGLRTVRVGSANDAAATAAAIAEQLAPAARVVVVNAERFADGVAAASLAAAAGWPVLLTAEARIPQVTVDVWRKLGTPPATVLGGTGVISENVARFLGATRLAGVDRYETAVAAANASVALGRTVHQLVAATGTAFPDALSAAAFAARTGGVTVLVDGATGRNDSSVKAWLVAHRPEIRQVHILGGPAAITPDSAATVASSARG